MKTKKSESNHPFPIRQLIDVSNNREEFISSSGLDINPAGILCEVDKEIDLHSRVYMLIQYPASEESFELEAIVVKLEKSGKMYLIFMEYAYHDPERERHVKKFMKSISR